MTNTTMLRTNVHSIPDTLDFLAELGVPTVGLNALIYSGQGLTVGTGLNESELQPVLDMARQKTEEHGQRLIWYTPTQYCQFDPMQLRTWASKAARPRCTACASNQRRCAALPVVLPPAGQPADRPLGFDLEPRALRAACASARACPPSATAARSSPNAAADARFNFRCRKPLSVLEESVMKRFRFYSLPVLWAVISLACSLITPQPATGVPPTAVVDVPTPVVPSTPAPSLLGKIAYASERGGLWQVIAMNADGSDETSLTASFGAYSRPSWSPDGTRLGMRMDISSSNGIAVMDVRHENGKLAGSQPVAVTSDFSDGPSWSPDGKNLIYSSTQDNSGWLTFISDISTGASQQITAIPENATDPDLVAGRRAHRLCGLYGPIQTDPRSVPHQRGRKRGNAAHQHS